jgi:hypothetical protein
MQHVPIIISVIALIVSILSFYWANIYDPKKLILVRIDRPNLDTLSFALVNSSRHDVMLVAISSYIELSAAQGGGALLPNWQIRPLSGEKSVIKGKEIAEFEVLCSPQRLPYDGPGHLSHANFPDFILQRVGVQVSWLNVGGNLFSASVLHSIFGARPNEEISMRAQILNSKSSVNLYALTNKVS